MSPKGCIIYIQGLSKQIQDAADPFSVSFTHLKTIQNFETIAFCCWGPISYLIVEELKI